RVSLPPRELGQVGARLRAGRRRRGRERALGIRHEDHDLLGEERLPKAIRGEGQGRLAGGVREEPPGELRQRPRVPPRGSGGAEGAERRPSRRPETRKTTSAVRLRGSSSVSVYRGGRKKKLTPSVARMAARTPGPLCHTEAQRKTASSRSSATEASVRFGKSF